MVVQLDTKTVYSFMDSMVSISQYVQRAKEGGYQAIGIMDHRALYGAFEFVEACRTHGIQPILGVEIPVQLSEELSLAFQFIALNQQGYQQLLKLSTASMMGRAEWVDLLPYVKEMAVIIPYQPGVEDLDLGVDYLIGVAPDQQDIATNHLLIAHHTVRLFSAEDVESLQVLRAIRDNVALHEVAPVDPSQVLLPAAELEEHFGRESSAWQNLISLVRSIHYHWDFQLKLPRFNPARPAAEELRERAVEGLKSRGCSEPAYLERLEMELSVIHQMGFDDYFLIVWDLLRFGRSKGYYMGMGRGSAAGSLVAYALSITGIDPLANDLLFERFLNTERYSMPDIDIDIPDLYRPEFIRYVRDRYGTMHTAQIVTFSTFGAKQALRDVLKRFGAPEYELTNITKHIRFNESLEQAFAAHASFRQVIQSKPEYQKAFEVAKRIEGNPRQTSIHAAGVVVSDQDLTDIIPLKSGEDMHITQYDAHAVEANGLLKMDFLGLRNLTFAQKMQEALRKSVDPSFRMDQVDLEDAKTLDLFARGETKGIFQFEQPGAIRLLKRVKPTSFEDVVATTSLNRPGSSDYASNFVRRKHGQEAVDVLDPVLAPILESTYGVMLYQEQVMQIAQVYAGFTLGKADILRRAMGKKDPATMHQMKADFLKGAQDLGHSPEKAESIFERMEKFAGYGFNRSHAYAYSALAFQLAYVKAHYPDIFFEVMTNRAQESYVFDALHLGYEMNPITFEGLSMWDRFSNGKVTLGLRRIKGFPKDLVQWLIEQRPFSSVEDLVLRLPDTYRKKDWLQPLVEIGLLDGYGHTRRTILENLDNLLVFAETFGSFFAEESYAWTEREEFDAREIYEMEQAVVGVGISPHPLQQLRKHTKRSIIDLGQLVEDERATILVEIQSIRTIRTKTKGELMAFLKVSDTQSTVEVTVFPESYRKWSDLLIQGNLVYMSGRVQKRQGQLQLVADQVEEAQEKKYWLLVEDHRYDTEIAQLLKNYPGTIPVVIHYKEEGKTVELPHLTVQASHELEEQLASMTLKTVYK